MAVTPLRVQYQPSSGTATEVAPMHFPRTAEENAGVHREQLVCSTTKSHIMLSYAWAACKQAEVLLSIRCNYSRDDCRDRHAEPVPVSTGSRSA